MFSSRLCSSSTSIFCTQRWPLRQAQSAADIVLTREGLSREGVYAAMRGILLEVERMLNLRNCPLSVANAHRVFAIFYGLLFLEHLNTLVNLAPLLAEQVLRG